MSCEICFTDLTPQNIITLSCSCVFCDSCIYQWAREEISSLKFRTTESLICPRTDCKSAFKYTDLFNFLKKDQIEVINQDLFKVYTRKSTDIKNCPNKECDFVGYIDKTHLKCKEDFICSKCNITWRDKELNSNKSWKDYGMDFLKVDLKEFLTDTYTEIFTNTCPACGIKISKNGGCPHMTCKACHHEFCWFCTQNYRGHCDIRCLLSVTLKLLTLIIFLMHIMVNTGFHLVLRGYIIGLFWFLLKAVLFNGVLFAFFLLYHDGHYQYSTVKHSRNLRYKLERMKNYILCELSLTLVYLLGLWYFDAFYTCFAYYMAEGLIFLGVMGFHNYLKKWIKATY